MAQSAPMYHRSTATLFITYRANSMKRFRFCFVFFLTMNVCKERFGEGWMISTCCDFSVLLSMFTGRTSTQTQLGDNQPDTSNRLLVTTPKFPRRRLSLDASVRKQGEERWLGRARVLISDRIFCLAVERSRVSSHSIHIQQNGGDSAQHLWWTNWMRVLTMI